MSGSDLKQNERDAISSGGRIAGAYLEQIGQFDLRNLTPDQWAEFCDKMFQGTCEAMRRQAKDSIPF
ncbi:DUF6511 domain-containing protein [uncultured Ruegeria sp.]|uniref:DUF6511 domain-containing protein n=1 Tax=uncultured Ruegeria sp. TaxID=259304 RepID=UPI002636A66C|nr:DUF6511 domain-containing protein [uncultured Ruegeria sp.]